MVNIPLHIKGNAVTSVALGYVPLAVVREPRLAELFGAAQRLKPDNCKIPTPIIYDGPSDFRAIFDVYSSHDPERTGKNMVLVGCKLHRRPVALSTMSQELVVPVFVQDPDVAKGLVQELRTREPKGMPLFWQALAQGQPVPFR